MFSQVSLLDEFFSNVDIYNYYDPVMNAPIIKKQMSYQIDMGIDHKQALIQKAFALGAYNEVKVCDVNQQLPLSTSSYKTIFCNILYWLENYQEALKEFKRVLADNGQIILTVPNETFRNYSFYQRLHVQDGYNPQWAWLSLLDRGRSGNIKLCQSYDKWITDFTKAGLQVVKHRQYLSKTIVEMWDIGLRPISPILIEMANKLDERDRNLIKDKWISSLLPLIEPLCNLEWETDEDYPAGFHLFVLEKV